LVSAAGQAAKYQVQGFTNAKVLKGGVAAWGAAGYPVAAADECARGRRRRYEMFEGFEPRDVETSGARIHLRHGGDGPPLLLLHGNPLTHVSWHKVAIGYREFYVAGLDRGARTTHRMCLDHPTRVKKAALVDILPNYYIWTHASKQWAMKSWHWLFMAQPYDLPEQIWIQPTRTGKSRVLSS